MILRRQRLSAALPYARQASPIPSSGPERTLNQHGRGGPAQKPCVFRDKRGPQASISSRTQRRRIISAGASGSIRVVEDCMVQNIEEFGPELCGEAFFEFHILHDRQIPVLESQVAEVRSGPSTDGPVREESGQSCFRIAAVVRSEACASPVCGSSVQSHCLARQAALLVPLKKGMVTPRPGVKSPAFTVEIPELSIRGYSFT